MSADDKRVKELEGDGSDLPFGSVVIDRDGDAWQHHPTLGWELSGESGESTQVLNPKYGPYIIAWTPEENVNELRPHDRRQLEEEQ